MPTNDQIAVIKSTFAERYDLDLAAIRDDGEALKTAVEAAGAGRLNSKACFSYDDQAAFIQDLDTFDLSKAAPDSRLDAKHIETNLNEAMKLAQTCMQLRSYYGELARHRNETRFRGEEFVRLDDVHRMEVKAGLFSMPWREASDERQGLEAALTHATSQRRIPQDMLSGSVAQCR
uniref:hypothetical protein n=1 Tax=Methylobacterium sp. B34 TaxID=95563 RepID=UPI0005B28C2E